jgi:hypothetical protein
VQCLNEKARCGRQRATTSINQAAVYPRHRPASKAFFRRPHAATVAATGALALYLIARVLPQQERAFGWALVEKWLTELVEARHGGQRRVA